MLSSAWWWCGSTAYEALFVRHPLLLSEALRS